MSARTAPRNVLCSEAFSLVMSPIPPSSTVAPIGKHHRMHGNRRWAGSTRQAERTDNRHSSLAQGAYNRRICSPASSGPSPLCCFDTHSFSHRSGQARSLAGFIRASPLCLVTPLQHHMALHAATGKLVKLCSNACFAAKLLNVRLS